MYILFKVYSDMISFSGADIRNFWHIRVFLWIEAILPACHLPVNESTLRLDRLLAEITIVSEEN
jgi:hypothetical protein